MREPYIPLFSSTIRSSLWSLSGDALKVFLTLALEADPEGYVSASVDGIRRLTGLNLEDVQRHLVTLEGPDPHSKDLTRSPGGTGARVERVPNGWRVLNLQWYRDEARKQAELARKRRWWAEKGTGARRAARPTEKENETDPIFSPEFLDLDPDQPDPVTPTRKLAFFAPDDFEPSEKHRVRCQELRADVDVELRAFKAHEFNRAYSDWPRRFSKWIEESKVRAETERGMALSRGGRGPRSDVQASPGTPQPSHVPSRLIAFCADHSLDCPALLAAHLRGGAKWESASDQAFWSGFAKRLATAAKEKANAPIKRNGRPGGDRQEHGAPPQPGLRRRDDSLLGVPEDGGAPTKPALPIVPGSGVAPAERARPAVRTARADRGGQE